MGISYIGVRLPTHTLLLNKPSGGSDKTLTA